MANATDYLEQRLLKFLFKNNVDGITSPGDSIYVGLATAASAPEAGTVAEVNSTTEDTNYERKQVSASGWTVENFTRDPSGVNDTTAYRAKNANNIEFDASSGTASFTVTHVFIADQLVGGNILFVGALTNNKTIQEDDQFRINAGNLTIELR